MADHHKGYAVPIGGVVAYKDSISPSGVGFDIACGNKAVLLDMPGSALRAGISKIMDGVFQTISFGIGRRNEERVDHPLFESSAWKCGAAAPLKQMAREQLGTVGSGNHYVDLFMDEQDRVWIAVLSFATTPQGPESGPRNNVTEHSACYSFQTHFEFWRTTAVSDVTG